MPRFLSKPTAAHLFAALCALTFAAVISQTQLVTSAVQFVAPLGIVVLCHLLWMMAARHIAPGFARPVLRRSLGTALYLAAGVLLIDLFAPMPAAAEGDVLEVFLTITFCIFVLLLIVGIAALLIYGLWICAKAIFSRSPPSDGPETRLFDVASLALVFGALGLASFEGVPGAYAFEKAHSVTAARSIAAPPEAVWTVMETSTAPDFPLPDILDVFPRPTQIVTDEGMSLGARRDVAFSGREGAGLLSLKVTERSAHKATFAVQGDTTPFSQWIGFERLSFEVLPTGTGSDVIVTLDFTRHLSPAWAFTPMMRGAGWLAMDVLARDIQTRAGP